MRHFPWIHTRRQLTKTEVKIPELAKCSVLMRERTKVEERIQAMQCAGGSRLQVISDFDMTLTRFAFNGKRVPTTHSRGYSYGNVSIDCPSICTERPSLASLDILNNTLLISEDCKKKIRELHNTFYPVEIDASRTAEEKLPHMVEWWTNSHELLIQQKIRKDLVLQAVQESNVMLRDGYKVFFDHLYEQLVPLLVFSAGIGDVLEEVMRKNHVFHPNVHVVSNYMDFDDAGVLQAFKGQLIHTFNKGETAVSQTAGLQQMQGRPNVLLLGDSLGDLTMADGVAEPRNILTVGFLNDQVEERKESYINSFDIVLVKDETMDVPNAILRNIITSRDCK